MRKWLIDFYTKIRIRTISSRTYTLVFVFYSMPNKKIKKTSLELIFAEIARIAKITTYIQAGIKIKFLTY